MFCEGNLSHPCFRKIPYPLPEAALPRRSIPCNPGRLPILGSVAEAGSLITLFVQGTCSE